MWYLPQNDGPTTNVLMHIIIYSTVYEKKCICISIGCVGLYIYFGIRATVKLLEKKGCYRDLLLKFSSPPQVIAHTSYHVLILRKNLIVDPQYCPMTLVCFLGVSLASSLIDTSLGPLCLTLSVFEPRVNSPWVVLCYRIEMRPPLKL